MGLGNPATRQQARDFLREKEHGEENYDRHPEYEQARCATPPARFAIAIKLHKPDGQQKCG
jgi:hypothetical protein